SAALAALLLGLAAAGQASAADCRCAKTHHRASTRPSTTHGVEVVNLYSRPGSGQATISPSQAGPDGNFAPAPPFWGVYGVYDGPIPLGFGPGYVIASGFAYDPPRGWFSPGFWRGRPVYGSFNDDDWRRP